MIDLLLNGTIKTIVLDPKFSKQIYETPLAFIRTLALPDAYQHGCLGKILKDWNRVVLQNDPTGNVAVMWKLRLPPRHQSAHWKELLLDLLSPQGH